MSELLTKSSAIIVFILLLSVSYFWGNFILGLSDIFTNDALKWTYLISAFVTMLAATIGIPLQLFGGNEVNPMNAFKAYCALIIGGIASLIGGQFLWVVLETLLTGTPLLVMTLVMIISIFLVQTLVPVLVALGELEWNWGDPT